MRTRDHDTSESTTAPLSVLTKHVLAQLQRTHPASSEFRVLAAVLIDIVEVQAGTGGARQARRTRSVLVRGEVSANGIGTRTQRERLEDGTGAEGTATDDPEICS